MSALVACVKSFAVAAVVLTLCAGLALVGRGTDSDAFTWPLSSRSSRAALLPVVVSFIINWSAFVPAAIARTEVFYDLTGSLSFLSIIATGVAWEVLLESRRAPASPLATNADDDEASSSLWRNTMNAIPLSPRQWVPCVLTAIWACRLGGFLLRRIVATPTMTDKRFDKMRNRPSAFFVAWSLQATWACLVTMPVVFQLSSTTDDTWSWYVTTYTLPSFMARSRDTWVVGLLLWVFGFALEVVADSQKSTFRDDPRNKGRFIQGGVWSWCRHPNYFGEITLWTGIFVMGLPSYDTWVQGAIAALSPAFTALLLIKVSGIPMIERAADRKWGDDPAYVEYKKRVHVLVPFAPGA